MLECLTCKNKLIEAFQHLKYSFLICRRCFTESINTYNNNAYNRVSMLTNQVSQKIKMIQKNLQKFMQVQKISIQCVFHDQIMDLYQKFISQKNEFYDTSTQCSVTESNTFEIEHKNKVDLYSKYNWLTQKIRQKISTQYDNLKQTKIGMTVAQKIVPVKQSVIEKSNKWKKGLEYIKKEVKSIQRQSPSFADIKKFNFGGLIRQKYKGFF